MIENSVSLASSSKSTKIVPSGPVATVLIVGGKNIFRQALQEWLVSRNIAVAWTFENERDLAEQLSTGICEGCDVVIQILAEAEPFTTFRRIHDALSNTKHPIPLVIVAEQATRGQVYAALRIGAKAYVNLGAEPEELVKAITMAASNKVYLAPDAAEVLINDVSNAIDEPSSRAKLPQVTLSRREVEIVQLLCEGLSSKEIARSLHISAKTVENHRYNIYKKCGAESLASLMRYAIHHGLISI